MGIADKIYNKLPVAFQNVSISIFGYFWYNRRFGGVFKEQLNEFKSREFYTEEEWLEYQNKELRKLLIHAFVNVPFYRDKYSNAGFALEDFNRFTLDDLPNLPYLEKEELREYGKTSLLSEKIDKKGAFYTSSGSTGTPTNIYISKKMHQTWSAVFESRIRNWAGVSKDCSRGMIGGRLVVPSTQDKPPYHRFNSYENQVYFSLFHLSKNTIESYIKVIFEKKLDYITGYANSVWLLAKNGLEKGILGPKLKAIITSSEKLTPEMRKEISQFFSCQVFDSYSGIEACGLISECSLGGLHWSPDIAILETIDINSQETRLKEIVCTSLINYDQPLIRYRIGDLVSYDENTVCNCGRKMPIIKEIVGRTDDLVTLPDGRQFGSFNRFFAEINGISKAQVVQEFYDQFTLNVVPNKDFSDKTLSQIKRSFKSRLNVVKLEINILEDIPLSANGKFKAVISKISKK
jgi:phenylacetate-CoA ligase